MSGGVTAFAEVFKSIRGRRRKGSGMCCGLEGGVAVFGYGFGFGFGLIAGVDLGFGAFVGFGSRCCSRVQTEAP